MPEVNKSNLSAPPSQKADPNASSAKPDDAKQQPKIESTGAVKTPTGDTAKADEIVNKTGIVTGDKSKEAKSEEPEPFEKNFSKIDGEILQGDSFRLILQRGNKTIHIPVPIQGTNNITILDNTFRIVRAIAEVKNEKELNEKFASFVVNP